MNELWSQNLFLKTLFYLELTADSGEFWIYISLIIGWVDFPLVGIVNGSNFSN